MPRKAIKKKKTKKELALEDRARQQKANLIAPKMGIPSRIVL